MKAACRGCRKVGGSTGTSCEGEKEETAGACVREQAWSWDLPDVKEETAGAQLGEAEDMELEPSNWNGTDQPGHAASAPSRKPGWHATHGNWGLAAWWHLFGRRRQKVQGQQLLVTRCTKLGAHRLWQDTLGALILLDLKRSSSGRMGMLDAEAQLWGRGARRRHTFCHAGSAAG